MSTLKDLQIAYLGLGIMGSAMAANLSAAGAKLIGWNRTPGRSSAQTAENAGATIVTSLQEAVRSADIIFTCLSDVGDVESVILGKGGVAECVRKGAVVIDMTTIGPQAAKNLKAGLKKHGVRFLDAPVTGGDVGARMGTLTIMVGGDKADLEECRPYLEVIGTNIIHCGPVGSGQSVKLCNQVLCAINMVSLCESLLLAQELGIDPRLVVDVCSKGAGGSWALTNLGPRAIEADFQPGFMIKHIIKDLRLVAESLKSDRDLLPGVELADRRFKLAATTDDGKGEEQGTQAMMRAYLKHL